MTDKKLRIEEGEDVEEMDMEGGGGDIIPLASDITADFAQFLGRWNPVTRQYEKKVNPITGEEIDVLGSSTLNTSAFKELEKRLKTTPEEGEVARKECEKYALLTTGIYVPATREDELDPNVFVTFKPNEEKGVEERVKYILPDPRNPEHRALLFKQRCINLYTKDSNKESLSEKDAILRGSRVPFSVNMEEFASKYGISNIKRLAIDGAVINSTVTIFAQGIRDLLREQCLLPTVVKVPSLLRFINQSGLPLAISSFNLIKYYMIICKLLPSKFDKLTQARDFKHELGTEIPEGLRFLEEWTLEHIQGYMQRVHTLKTSFAYRMEVLLRTEAKKINAQDILDALESRNVDATKEERLYQLQELSLRLGEFMGDGDLLQRMIASLNVKESVKKLEEELGIDETHVYAWIVYQRDRAAHDSLLRFFESVSRLILSYGEFMGLEPSENPVSEWAERVSGNPLFLHDYWLLLVQRTDEYIAIQESFILMCAFNVIPTHYVHTVFDDIGNVIGTEEVDVWKELSTVPNIPPHEGPLPVPTGFDSGSSLEERLQTNPVHMAVFHGIQLLENGMLEDGAKVMHQQMMMVQADYIERRGLDREAFMKYKDDSPRLYGGEALYTVPTMFQLQQSLLHTVFLIGKTDEEENYKEIQAIYEKNVKEQIEGAKARGERITFVTRTGETVSSFEDKKRERV